MATLKQLALKKDLLAPGHRLCAGCTEPSIVRQILLASDKPVVVANSTGCLEVSTTVYPYTSWRVSYIHNAFENAAATASGIEAAIKALKRKGKKIDDYNVVVFAGDGGTYDIGLQSLSGALERQHKFVYVCLDNEAYMNTGIQRSSATPSYAWTSTTPVGKVEPGKKEPKKDLTLFAVAHNIPYVATASPSHFMDLIRKVEKAFSVNGPAVLNIIAPCPRGWRYPTEMGIKIARLAVETGVWPLYEVEDGKYRITFKPRELKPVEEWLKPQGRFRHLFKPGNEELLEQFKKMVEKRMRTLEIMEKATQED
ncbi:MAG: thiamine pyrophosphate-dependent enzyme [Actinobacteria bacterium]|nr:thiamine pyrophosphate-dependent enzyme [Actinomycetota bacterium]